MESRVFQAAQQGDTNVVHALLEEDPLALHKVALLPYADSPLHIATLAGRINFVKVIMRQMPAFAWDRNKDGFTPLHIASAMGNVDIVREILMESPDLCLIKDNGGRTPLHYATIKGRIHVMHELLSKCPQSAREVTANRETALHLAVTNSQFEAFRVLIEKLSTEDNWDLLNAVDGYGNNIMQLAESMKQIQVLNLLREHSMMKMEHIIEEIQDQEQEYKSKTISVITVDNQDHSMEIMHDKCIPPVPPKSLEQAGNDPPLPLLSNKGCKIFPCISIGTVPILACILATTAFKGGISPPTTILKPDMKLDGSCFFHTLRHSISLTESIDQCPPITYYLFLSFNTAGFYCAVLLIFLHHIPGFLQTLLPTSLVLLLLSYLVLLLATIPNALAFLVVNSVALLTFAYVFFINVMGKKCKRWTLNQIKCTTSGNH